jgi:putative DNA primase/helicase
MLQAASWYAARGLPVFPLHSVCNGVCSCAKPACTHPGKHPRTSHGFKEATTDETQIAAWWGQWPDANIGMPTGEASGLLVLDVDPRNGGDDSLERLIAKHGRFPDTAEQISGGGGRHYAFRDSGITVPKSLAPGIDLKANGGYIVVAPSVHFSGSLYQWDGIAGAKALLNPADPPTWLLEEIESARRSDRIKTDSDIGEKWAEGRRNNNLTSVAGSMRRRGMSREAIEAALIEENRQRCNPPLSECEVRWIAESVARYEPERRNQEAPMDLSSGWPEPLPIRGELPPVEPFYEDLLPASFRPLVSDISERMQVPLDYPAIILVLCLAGAVNRRATIQPKAKDTGWVVVPNLWGGIIAAPGLMKSPVIQACTRPLLRIQAEWRWEYDAALADYEREKEEAELRRSAWRDQFKSSAKKNSAAPERPQDLPAEPKLKRLIVNDATVEAMHQTMNENPAGILVVRDELTGWWSQLDRAGREGERAFCLQAWNGDTGHTIDRIGRGTVHVAACCMSMLGGIQPGRLRSYLADALKDGPSNDGLIQRFQLLVWPEFESKWEYVDRPPDQASEARVIQIFHRLVALDVEDALRFRFSHDAQKLFIDWLCDLETKVRNEELHPALVAHLGKYRKLMPSLGLLFELADRAAGDVEDLTGISNEGNDYLYVSLEHAKQAAGWCDYLETHARRIYSCITTPQLRAAQVLAEKIEKKRVGADGSFSCRDIYLKGWSGLETPEIVKLAVQVLQDAGWLRVVSSESGTSGGRPSDRYEINPKVRK